MIPRRFLVIPVLLCLAGTLFGLDFNSPGTPEELSRALVDEMTDEEALAQTFMLGWVGATPSPLIMDWIRDRNIGGVKIFGWNTDNTLQLAETVGNLQEKALEGRLGIPLFVATDQEGGWIRHVKGATSETPGNMAIGASGYPMDAYYSGYYIGRELALLGINMNFAPTVDLYTNRDSTLIGSRAFGDDPVKAGILGAAFVKGHRDAGVIATAKHYPGHGDTDLDSHGVLPKIDASFDVLWNRELVPYRMLSKEGIPAIMSGHLAFPMTPSGSTPASLSSWFLKDILRDKIGFTGLVITDDLMMNGATMSAGSLSRAAKEALLAGNDIVMLSKTPNMNDVIWRYLAASMETDAVFRECVRDAARRILKAKLEFLRGGTAVAYIPDLDKVRTGIPDPEGSAFFLDLAARSVTLVESPGDDSVFPLLPEDAGSVLLAGQFREFFSAGKAAFPDALSYWYSPSQGTAEMLRYARQADTIIFCLSDEAGLRVLQNLRSLGKRVVVFSVLSPVYLDTVPWIDGAVAVYSYAAESFIAGFSAILGRFPAKGTIPFPLHEPRWTDPHG
ncbi:glycoside hydrolase family 3 protein [Breznakiella homolactica]|uniref:beta-N-acetylhexosaminidase n=1 Tax=Breznakiella homolactica TaxID=2798577 RepID=A0A7T7XNU2_9SPIR|nr:glycoside hydrolase family 3 protein [Breznakiella homolactica]QQO09658.1 glycoside hydrolase family 3 protein [Breznakiella homolactica]